MKVVSISELTEFIEDGGRFQRMDEEDINHITIYDGYIE